MDTLASSVSNLQNVILFLLPGFLTILLFYYQIPDRKKADLTITVLSVITSLVLTAITTWFFLFLKSVMHSNVAINADNIWFIWTRILLGILFSLVLARFVQSDLFSYFNKKIFKVEVYPFGRLWNTFFKIDRGHETVVKVFLQDGTSYIGKLEKASYNPDDDVQELELLDPYYFSKLEATVEKIKETESVLIQGSAITSVEKITDEEAKKLYQFPSRRGKKK